MQASALLAGLYVRQLYIIIINSFGDFCSQPFVQDLLRAPLLELVPLQAPTTNGQHDASHCKQSASLGLRTPAGLPQVCLQTFA